MESVTQGMNYKYMKISREKDIIFATAFKAAICTTPFGIRLQKQLGEDFHEWPSKMTHLLLKRKRSGDDVVHLIRTMVERGWCLRQITIVLALNMTWDTVDGPTMTCKIRSGKKLWSRDGYLADIKSIYDYVLKG